MVLPLKRWKSRSSPGIEADVSTGNPFMMFEKPLPDLPRGGFFVSGPFCPDPASLYSRLERVRQAGKW